MAPSIVERVARDIALEQTEKIVREEIERLKTKLDALLAEKDAAIRELREAYQDLGQQMEVLQRSLGYRLLEGYRRGMGRLFPPASLRGRAYLMFVQGLKAVLNRFAFSPRRRRPER